MMVPIPMSGAIDFRLSIFNLLVKKEINNKNNIDNSIRYQTSNDSFKLISFPNTPVKPARKIAI